MQIDVERGTIAAALSGRATLERLARGSGTDEGRMARAARVAIFEEALLGALRARFNEVRNVAK